MTDAFGKPDYGIDAPTVVRNLTIVLIVLLVVAGGWRLAAGAWGDGPQLLVDVACGNAFGVAVMLWSSRVGKFRVRDRLLDSIAWRGDERVLDVGCGRGLAAIGAAHRLTTGHATGVDLWSQRDLSNNGPEAARANAEAEGVRTRVTFETGDARRLPFADASFDVVVSMTALHNIASADDRATALAEIARVLAPGGRLALFDIFKTREYRARLAGLGFTDIALSRPVFLWLMPGRRIDATAPLSTMNRRQENISSP